MTLVMALVQVRFGNIICWYPGAAGEQTRGIMRRLDSFVSVCSGVLLAAGPTCCSPPQRTPVAPHCLADRPAFGGIRGAMLPLHTSEGWGLSHKR